MKTFEKIDTGVYRILKPGGIAQALADWSRPDHRDHTTYFKYVNGVPLAFPTTLKFERVKEPFPKVMISQISTPSTSTSGPTQ